MRKFYTSNIVIIIIIFLVLMVINLACSNTGGTASENGTKETKIAKTVEAQVAIALEETVLAETVEAQVAATLEATSTPTLTPTSTPSPTPTPTPTPTPVIVEAVVEHHFPASVETPSVTIFDGDLTITQNFCFFSCNGFSLTLSSPTKGTTKTEVNIGDTITYVGNTHTYTIHVLEHIYEKAVLFKNPHRYILLLEVKIAD